LDDEYLEDLKVEIIEVHQLATDQDAKCRLDWTLERSRSRLLRPPRESRHASGEDDRIHKPKLRSRTSPADRDVLRPGGFDRSSG
jgi:hypothetical protein